VAVTRLPAGAALLVVDVQRAIDHPGWGVRNHPGAERRIAELLRAWRERGMAIYHIRHDSVEPDSTYRPGQPGHDFKPEALPLAGEPVIGKATCCAFVGTDLERRLREAGHGVLVFAGVTTNNSVEATVRMVGCLGFDGYLVEDACFTFGRTDWNGAARTADEVHAMSLANLHGEYCTVVTAVEVLAACGTAPATTGGHELGS
jgi:nicotinamidase-related amidase